ncbi:Importin-9 [Vitis vinifera]|uniref:Importin-9 n=1 Tax=Vitis vinifera TaxID=29760 RepID=A0A438ECT0_VITVI|nr:Importin-9 [Vitis vinifera]
MADQDQQWLLNCLTATLDTSQEVRSFAEASLNQASLQPAAVLLKQFVKKHWQEGEENFEHPVVSSDEKEIIRRLLLLSLDDSNRKICTAISMAVSSIAHYDWPEDWPDLLPFLLKLINDQTNINGVHGALRCLALLSGDLDDTVVPKLVPVLFPCLHTIVSSPQTETSNLMMPMLKPWMDQFSTILEHPVQSEDPDDWSIRMEVLKCLNQFVQNFPSLTETEFKVVVGPLWQTFVSSLRVYELSSVEVQMILMREDMTLMVQRKALNPL